MQNFSGSSPLWYKDVWESIVVSEIPREQISKFWLIYAFFFKWPYDLDLQLGLANILLTKCAEGTNVSIGGLFFRIGSKFFQLHGKNGK